MAKGYSRRQFLSSIGTLTAATFAVPGARTITRIGRFSGSSHAALGGIPLKSHAARQGLLYGAAARQATLSADSKFSALFAQQCAILVPETELKWNALRPTPDSFNFAAADWLCTFAKQHQMKFRGHTLVWHLALPSWFDSYANPGNAQHLLLNHIAKVVGRYAGKIHSWDVINEAIAPEDKRGDGLRNSPWLQMLAPAYIETAFHSAAAADPHALLVWNENWLEEETSYGEAKRTFLLQHLRDLLKRNVPIHAIGIQSHLVGSHTNIAGPQFAYFLQQVSDLGLKVLVTEMDVRDYDLPADISTRDGIVAQRYYQYLTTALHLSATIAVLTWGLSDKYTWLATYTPRPDGLPVRPLPFDANMNPTPGRSAIARAFDQVPQRGANP